MRKFGAFYGIEGKSNQQNVSGATGATGYIYRITNPDNGSNNFVLTRIDASDPSTTETVSNTSGVTLSGNVSLAYSESTSQLAVLNSSPSKLYLFSIDNSGTPSVSLTSTFNHTGILGTVLFDKFTISLKFEQLCQSISFSYLDADDSGSSNATSETILDSNYGFVRLGLYNSNLWYIAGKTTGGTNSIFSDVRIGQQTLYASNATVVSSTGTEFRIQVTQTVYDAVNITEFVVIGISKINYSGQTTQSRQISSKDSDNILTFQAITGSTDVGDTVRILTGLPNARGLDPETTGTSITVPSGASFSVPSFIQQTRHATMGITSRNAYVVDNTTSDNVYRITSSGVATLIGTYAQNNSPVAAVEGDDNDIIFVDTRRNADKVEYVDDAATATTQTATFTETGPVSSSTNLVSRYAIGQPFTVSGGEGDPEVTTIGGLTYMLPHDDASWLFLRVGDSFRVVVKMILEGERSYHHKVTVERRNLAPFMFEFDSPMGPPKLQNSLPSGVEMDQRGHLKIEGHSPLVGKIVLRSAPRRGIKIRLERSPPRDSVPSLIDGYVIRESPKDHRLSLL